MRPSLQSSLRAILRLALAAVLLEALWRFAGKALAFLRSPWSRDYGEGCVLAMVQLLAERGTYFTSLGDYPYVHANYPPVFIALNWPLFAGLGPSLLWPRALSLAATAVLVVLMAMLGRRLTGRLDAGIALGALTIVPWFVQTWAAMGRVDMLACALSVAGLALAAGTSEGRVPWAAFACFGLAFFTKQNALLAPAAWLLHHLVSGDRRRFLREAAGLGLPLAALFGALVAGTGGEAWRHLVTYTAAARYEWMRMVESYGQFLALTGAFQAAIVAGLVRGGRRAITGARGAILIYWVLNWLGLATIAKSGAAQNYYIEPWLATLLAAAAVGPFLFEEAVASGRAGWRRPALESLLVLAALYASHGRPRADRIPQAIRNPQAARDLVAVQEALRATPDPVLSENLSLLVTNRRPVLVEPYGVWMLAEGGLLRPDRLLEDCARGRFGLVIVEYRLREIPGLGECLAARYAVESELGPYQLLRPVRPAGSVTPAGR